MMSQSTSPIATILTAQPPKVYSLEFSGPGATSRYGHQANTSDAAPFLWSASFPALDGAIKFAHADRRAGEPQRGEMTKPRRTGPQPMLSLERADQPLQSHTHRSSKAFRYALSSIPPFQGSGAKSWGI